MGKFRVHRPRPRWRRAKPFLRALALLPIAVACLAARATEDGVLLRCDPRDGELVIEHVLGEQPAGTRRPGGELVRFRDLLDVERCGPGHANAGDACMVRAVRTAERACRLGTRTLSVHIAPQPYNYNLQGYCGGRITGALEIREGDRVLLPSTRLDPDQDCASETMQVVKTVRVRSDESAARVTYGSRFP